MDKECKTVYGNSRGAGELNLNTYESSIGGGWGIERRAIYFEINWEGIAAATHIIK